MISLRTMRPALGLLVVVALSLVASADSAASPCPDCPPVPAPLDIACPTVNPLSSRTPQKEEGAQVAVGKIPDGFSVSSSGEAVYSLTFNVPPGRQGMEPHIGLTYNSSHGESPYGMGFALSGLSSITRCASNIAQDKRIRGVRYDNEDNFCLDGLRLVQVGEGSGSTEFGQYLKEYRTFPDTFRRVRAYSADKENSPQMFEAETKSGRIVRYGESATSPFNGRVMGKDGAVRAWAITRETDRHDNGIEYTYQNDRQVAAPGGPAADGHTITHVPLRIDYTAHYSAPTKAPTHAVVFSWFDGNRHVTAFTGGMQIDRRLRLGHVRMLGPGDVPVRSYHLTYGFGHSQRTHVADIVECAGDSSNCRPSTKLDWLEQPGNGFKEVDTGIAYPTHPPDHDYTETSNTQSDIDNGTTTIGYPVHELDPAYRWLLADVTGDGLSDLVVSQAQTVGCLAVNGNVVCGNDVPPGVQPWPFGHGQFAVNAWNVATNLGGTLSSLTTWRKTALPVQFEMPQYASFAHQGFNIVPADIDQDGKTDLLYYDSGLNGASSDVKVLTNTAPINATAFSEVTTSALAVGASTPGQQFSSSGILYADMNGDGVLDAITCEDGPPGPALNGMSPHATGTWQLRLWNPLAKNFAPDHQDPQPTDIPIDSSRGCYLRNYIQIVDVDGDGKSELLIPPMFYPREERVPEGGGGYYGLNCGAGCVYSAIQRDHAAPGGDLVLWRQYNTKLQAPQWDPGNRRLLFVDVNGDGLPDAVEAREDFQNRLWTYINTGHGFDSVGFPSLSPTQPQNQAEYFEYATTIDFDGDGQTDVLLPMKADICNVFQLQACWVILKAEPSGEGQFSPVPLNIPMTDEIDAIIDMSEPFIGANNEHYKLFLQTLIPRVADLNGDGRQDMVIPLNGTFKLFLNEGPRDLLTAMTDGMNPLNHEVFPDPQNPGFVPNIKIEYGNLVDHATTVGFPQDSPNAEDDTYLPRSDTPQSLNDCDYPRTCVVGAKRVVSSYELNNGQNHLRKFTMRYRNGRSHRLGRGFLGFGSVITTDEDGHTGHAELYDTVSEDDTLLNKSDPAHPFPITTFPFAGDVAQAWSWVLGLPGEDAPLTRMRLVDHKRSLAATSSLDPTNSIVPTYGNVTYFTLAKETFTREHEASYALSSVSDANKPVPPFVKSWAETSFVVALDNVRKTTHKITEWDTFGNVSKESDTTQGVDDVRSVERVVNNDTVTWSLGEATKQTMCSKVTSLGSSSQCRVTDRVFVNGDVESETIRGGDPASVLPVQATTSYIRDAFGNVTYAYAYDHIDGQRRAACVGYDSDGLFPDVFGNGAEHFTHVAYDKVLGVPIVAKDPNGIETVWKHDDFGRTTRETRQDGNVTLYPLQRLKVGGPGGLWWAIQAGAASPKQGVSGVQLDSLGRTVRSLTMGPGVTTCSDSGACAANASMLEQTIEYDLLGRVVKRSRPYVQGDPAGATLFTKYEYDNLGRVVSVKTPWNATTAYIYKGNAVMVTAPGTYSRTTNDPWGRPITVEDALGYETEYTYAHFGGSRTVTPPGNQTVITIRDAFGRVVAEADPDRGKTEITYDGFGQRMSTQDAEHLMESYHYDVLGRMVVKTDEVGQTIWHYDDPLKGLGRLSDVVNPAGITKSYTYEGSGQNGVGQVHTVQLTAGADSLTTTLDYDQYGRLSMITYPPSFGQAFQVLQQYDAYGHLIRVKDPSPTSVPYWELTKVNVVGQTVEEQLGGGAIATTRSYSPEKGTIEHILTVANSSSQAPKTVQDLYYTHDARLNLERRVDGLQIVSGVARGEEFTYDALDRLECSKLDTLCSAAPGASCPCDQSVTYQRNGNIDIKSDVGAYTYDPLHLHAVQTAGTSTYGYDNVGNQTDRPDMTIEYTPFDLPSKYTRKDGGVVTLLEYDGDQTRVRKSTLTDETLYFGDYERVTHLFAPNTFEHRYSVRSNERVIADVLRTTQNQGNLVSYHHVDHLGSTETVTNFSGFVVREKRSYDAFGAKRGPNWTKTTPPSTSSTTNGYTGHEDEEDFELVNMKGRIYDPRLARFLMTDPIVSNPRFSQSWNPYSYVMNSPLKFVDPTGFDPDPDLVKTYGPYIGDTVRLTNPGPDKDPSADDRLARAADAVNDPGTKDSGSPGFDYRGANPWEGYMGIDPDPVARKEQEDEAGRRFEVAGRGLVEFVEGGITQNRGLMWSGLKGYFGGLGIVDPSTMDALAHVADALSESGPQSPNGGVAPGQGQCVGAACTSSCFIAGTPVRTNEGTQDIDRLELGELVRTLGDEACSGINWGELGYVRFESRDNAELLIETLRPLNWIEANGYREGARIYLTLPEIEFEGEVVVAAVGARKSIEHGQGCPVLTKYSHLSSRVLSLQLAHSSASIGTTATHPFFSKDRGTWVHAADLVVGEHVTTMSGGTTVAGLEYTGRVERVFNVEIGLAHTYLVGDSAAWVHNAGCGFAPGTGKTALEGMRNDGGHAIRHLAGKNVIPDTGSLESRVAAFSRIAIPILEAPVHAVPWRIGDIQGRAFLGNVNGQTVAIVVAAEGALQGKVVSSFVPDPNQLQIMNSR